jgi:alkylation response protein AidB-like acyl-CoA dehydrogenase
MSTVTTATSEQQQLADLCEALLVAFPPALTDAATFLGAQFDAGLAWVHNPVGHGGLGLSPRLQNAINQRLLAAGAPNPVYRNPIGHGMTGPTVMAWGSDAQKARYMRPLFTGEEVWCQLFSEPGSGSDFAGLSSRGVKDGDEWVCNGQKVWTTLAHLSRWGLLVVRTNSEAVKHSGLTAFVVDMQAPGVEVRPLFQMTGEAEFNEVYFTDVRIPDAERLGAPGEGWRVSLTTLMNERVSIGGAIPPKGSGPIADAIAVWAGMPAEEKTPERRDELMKLWSRAEILRLTNIRAAGSRKMGDPGPEGSVAKLAMAELFKDIYAFAITTMGAEGMLYKGYTMTRPTMAMVRENVQQSFLRSRANSIEGGTSEVMRNILGERVLGLPGDVRVDRDRPWSEIPRN